MSLDNVKGPGMLWVTSNITKTADNPLTEKQFLQWYDDDHIPEIVETGGMSNAFRCVHANKSSEYGTSECPKPYLAFYPMQELGFTQGPDFKKIRVKSDLLPGTGIVFDMASIDVGYYRYVGQTGDRKGSPTYFLVSAITPANDTPDSHVNDFFDQQAKTISSMPKYQRTLRFQLLYARSNAQSRKLKGLPTIDEPCPELPSWMAVHLFWAEPEKDATSALKGDVHGVLEKAKQNQVNAYRLAKAQGEGKMFED